MPVSEGTESGWSYVVRWVRMRCRWTQQQAADACGIERSRFSVYEQGDEVPSRRTLQKLAEGSGISLAEMELMRPVLARRTAARPHGVLPITEAEEELVAGWAALSNVMEAALGRLRAELADPRAPAARLWADDRAWAEEAWSVFLACEPRERLVLVERSPTFRGRDFCVHLCEESEKAAPKAAALAVELARLARQAAELVFEPEGSQPLLQARAEAFLGNALRVAGDLDGGERAFAAARRLRASAPVPPPAGDLARILDLEASLRRAQRRYGEAVALHRSALAAAPADQAASIFLSLSATLQQKGDLADSITALKRAAALMDPKREPRQLCIARFNLAANLLDLGRAVEAAALLPEIRSLALALGNGLDLVRLRWLAGKIDAAQDRLAEAAQAIGEAHQAFVDRQIAYDAAFTALDLAEVHLRRGRTAEVRELALGTMEVLRAQKVPGGFLAAFQLFCQAAEQDAATAELVRRTVHELERARGGPE